MAFLREPIDEPRLISSGLSFPKLSHVCFFHPGYGSPGDDSASHVLLSLRAFDDGGVHYMTAHTACAIIAGNRWDGYFSHDRDEAKKIRPPRDGILREKSYYFWVPSSSTDPYPVIARFNDWRFPHNNLPPLWTQFKSQLSANEQMNEASNGYCCLSNYGNSVESAHLVPVAQSHWWMMNNMDQ
ncbi:hypothetical protein QQZ08_005234 [Neonectria magnoliae]|uniref:HNH nuclease domain-containing protein n=1 Tax=Neonectria magnoliae TaxID=2732573 RepID=A0ABR1I3R7_9HYPO